MRLPADREFVGLVLAEQDRARIAQPHPARGVLVRHMVSNLRPGWVRTPSSEDVLQIRSGRRSGPRAGRPGLPFGMARGVQASLRKTRT